MPLDGWNSIPIYWQHFFQRRVPSCTTLIRKVPGRREKFSPLAQAPSMRTASWTQVTVGTWRTKTRMRSPDAPSTPLRTEMRPPAVWSEVWYICEKPFKNSFDKPTWVTSVFFKNLLAHTFIWLSIFYSGNFDLQFTTWRKLDGNAFLSKTAKICILPTTQTESDHIGCLVFVLLFQNKNLPQLNERFC